MALVVWLRMRVTLPGESDGDLGVSDPPSVHGQAGPLGSQEVLVDHVASVLLSRETLVI